ncbi:amyloid beta A4 precursor protein-binding family B member 1-interacting protein-like [Ixodes scapularis]
MKGDPHGARAAPYILRRLSAIGGTLDACAVQGEGARLRVLLLGAQLPAGAPVLLRGAAEGALSRRRWGLNSWLPSPRARRASGSEEPAFGRPAGAVVLGERAATTARSLNPSGDGLEHPQRRRREAQKTVGMKAVGLLFVTLSAAMAIVLKLDTDGGYINIGVVVDVEYNGTLMGNLNDRSVVCFIVVYFVLFVKPLREVELIGKEHENPRDRGAGSVWHCGTSSNKPPYFKRGRRVWDLPSPPGHYHLSAMPPKTTARNPEDDDQSSENESDAPGVVRALDSHAQRIEELVHADRVAANQTLERHGL